MITKTNKSLDAVLCLIDEDENEGSSIVNVGAGGQLNKSVQVMARPKLTQVRVGEG